MHTLIYTLCAATALVTAWLLLRAYARTGLRLLFWSGLCFTGLTVNNLLLFIDLVVLPSDVDLRVFRHTTALVGMLFLIYGFIRESE